MTPVPAMRVPTPGARTPTRVQAKEGRQQVRLSGDRGVVTIVMRNGVVTSMSRVVQGMSIQLRPSATPTGGTSCSCGHACWEDDVLQQSICVCKSCGGGGGGAGSGFDSFFDVW